LNFIFGIVCLFVCVCAFSLRRESSDMILGDKPLIFEVVLSQRLTTRFIGLIYQHAIGTFNTCSRAPTHRSLTDTSGGYNLEGADFPHHTLRPSQPTISAFHLKASSDLQFNQYSTKGSKVQD
jgi:hypothetical protein